MDELEEDYAVGLDLGTTFSCIGVYKGGNVEIIPNKIGEKVTPSIVIIDNNFKILVGEDTTNYLVKFWDNCIYEIKRLIGRKYSDIELKKEIKKLPFKIIKDKEEDSPIIEIQNSGIPMTYSPVEISSFIIKKMVQTAEKYLNTKITKLVITVPAYFNDSQRKLTKQAAELVGLRVLRVINEPTAAALAYGFDKKQDINEKILVFDLGGGTFDVSILSVKKDENNPKHKVFQVLGTSGDTQLGGEDFDNKLVDYFLNKLNNKEEIKKNKECIQKLKINCEKIKKALSLSLKTTLRINDFYNNEDLCEEINRETFEDICYDLFKKLETSLEDALINAKLTKNEINEIILVGGSTRIPKIKTILQNYFPNCKINDSINPDEAVAFGATIECEKILHNKNDSISNFLLLDIIPLSLGTNIINKSKDPKIKDEGDVMSIIIKKGSPIPYSNSQTYYSVSDNETNMVIDIYEGENTFVKYNHLLKKSQICGLKKRPRGKTKVVVTFDIDINGILIVNAKEESENNDGQKMDPIIIKNDDISLSPEKIEKLKEKNKYMLDKIKLNDLSSDYSNLKEILKKYKDAYLKCLGEYDEKTRTEEGKKTDTNENEDNEEEDEEEAIVYITNFNNTLEEFIDSFDIDNNYDNETIVEKYYLYIRELFISYIETLKLKIEGGEKRDIITKIEQYINKFINKNSDYVTNLLEILNHGTDGKTPTKKTTKTKFEKLRRIFYGIVIFVMEKLNEYGNNYIKSNKKYCKYYSLICFEQANEYYEKYLSKIKEALLEKKEILKLKEQRKLCKEKINDITCGAIVLCNETFKGGYILENEIKSLQTGNTNTIRILTIGNLVKDIEIEDYIKKIDTYKIVLNYYEQILSTIQSSEEYKYNTKKEAICIANIIKINQILEQMDNNSLTLLRYAKRCKYIIDSNKDGEQFKKEKWCHEFDKLYNILKEKEPKHEEFDKISPKIKAKYPDIFNNIEKEFIKKSSKDNFIKFILKEYPYTNYENDKKNKLFDKYSLELVNFLIEKYYPDNYHYSEDEQSQLKYCIIHEISKKLNIMYTKP